MKLYIQQFWADRRGQDLVEYAIALGLVATAAVAAMPELTREVNTIFSKIASIVASASV